MKKLKLSGPQVFMHSVSFLMLIISSVCFIQYYGGYNKSDVILWVGISAFTIMYHFWVRIWLGNISKLFKKHINYEQAWFKEHKFERKLYKILNVKKWKDKAFTYNPESFSVEHHTLDEIANTMAKSEVDHWINEVISISTMFFSIPWGKFWIFFITALGAMIFDSQFIIIQRYNRPRIVKLLERQNKKETKKTRKVI